jgi:hypothetical protein
MSLVQVELGANAPGASAPGQETTAAPNAQIADALGQVLRTKYDEWEMAKREIVEDWLRDLRAFEGQYEPSVAASFEPGQSQVFVHLTRTKVMAAFARVVDLLFGTDRNWGIKSSPVPQVSPAKVAKIKEKLLELDPNAPVHNRKFMDTAVKKFCELAAEEMGQEIEDQLCEAEYEHKFKTAIMEICLLGSGAIKGPTVTVRTENKWEMTETGWETTVVEKPAPGVSAPSVFDLTPDPYATSLKDLTGMYERHVLTTANFRDLGSSPGFSKEAIEDIIRTQPNGNHTDLQHDTERRRIAGLSVSTTNNRYDVLEYWGQVTGQQLASAGFDINPDEYTAEYQANVWFSASRTIKVELNPLTPQRIPYQIACYEKAPHRFWGTGVAKQMRDSQAVINGSVRATLNNMGISSGPQVEINTNLLAPGQNTDLIPWKKWLREGGDDSTPMLRFYQPQNITGNLQSITEMFRRFVDEETSLPSYTHGETLPGLNKTASGMSMLMGAANVTIKTVIKNIDMDLTEPFIGGMYDWNMQWSDNDRIKGDMYIEARGSTALMAKEMRSQRQMQYAQITANPVDAQLIGPDKRANLLREIARSLDLNPDEVAPDERGVSDAAPTPTAPNTGGGAGGVPPNVGAGVGGGGEIPTSPSAIPAEGSGRIVAQSSA